MLNESDGVACWSAEARKVEIPHMVVLWLIGAIPHRKYRGGQGCALQLGKDFYSISALDFEVVERLGTKLSKELPHRIVTPSDWMAAHRMAHNLLSYETGHNPDKSIVMLKDKGGAGYWRMTLPARYMEKLLIEESGDDPDKPGQDVRIDVTSASVQFDSLLEYDTIFVQRVSDWDSYYTLEKLKKAGRRIVYDIDDDIFSLTPDNPAFHVISRDNQQAAAACMDLADVVTTTTAELAGRLAQVMEDGYPEVIPNAIDLDDGWLPTDQTGSPDGNRRIFWQGSATHEADWEVCIGAVDQIMRKYDDVRLVLLGYLPQVVIENLRTQPHWQNRVEHVGFSDTETYFQILKHVRAEVGIAPLSPKPFNEAKSPIKWLEYTCAGIPTVASNMKPYSEVIQNGLDGKLVNDGDWFTVLDEMLNLPADERRHMVKKAREAARDYDIRKVAAAWKEILLGNL